MNIIETYKVQKIERDKFIKALNPKSFDFQIATWFGTGLIVPAPGTWGTLGGLIFTIILYALTNSFFVFLTAVVLFFIGLNVLERLEKKLPNHDSSFIVIDEVVAIMLLFSLLPKENLYISVPLMFLIFRLLDAKKPFPIDWVDKNIKGAWGIMLDDLLAAIISIPVFILIAIFLFSFH